MAQERETAGRLSVHVVSLADGVQEYEGISIVRIKSRYYNLLIMDGYTPSIGEVEGDVSFVSERESVELKNIRGFYLHKKNVFRIMLREDSDVG